MFAVLDRLRADPSATTAVLPVIAPARIGFLRYYAEGPDAGPIPGDIVHRMADTLARTL